MPDGTKILIVDDEEVTVAALENLLESDDYFVVTASSGEDALAIVEEQPDIDLILLDIMTPGLDGCDFLEKLKRNPGTAGICVIVLTALEGVKSIVKTLSAGASDYIAKPFDNDELLARVEMHLNVQHAEKLLNEENDRLEEQIRECIAELEEKSEALEKEIAGRRKAEERISEEREKRRHVVTNTSHLLCTPMTIIMGNLELVEGDLAILTPELLGKIMRRLDDMKQLIDGLLFDNIELMTVETIDGFTPVHADGNRK